MKRSLGLAFLLAASAAVSACRGPGKWEKASAASLDLFEKGRYAEALPPGEEALALSRERFGPADVRTLLSLELVGRLHSRTGGLERSRELLAEAARLSKEVFGEGSPKRARFLASLAEVKEARGEFDEAEDLRQEVLVLVQGAYGAISAPAALGFSQLGELYGRWGLYEQAEPVLNRAGAILDRLDRSERAVRASLDAGLCRIMVETGRMDRARHACPAALSAMQALLPEGHPDMAGALAAMGLYQLRAGRPDLAEAHLKAALDAYAKAPSSDLQGRSRALMAMAELEAVRGGLAHAMEDFERAKADAQSPYAKVKALIREAGLDMRGGRPKDAALALNEAMAVHAGLPLADKLDREIILLAQGESSAALGRLAEAEGFLSLAAQEAEDRRGAGDSELIAILAALGRVQVSSGRLGKARATVRRLKEVGDGYGKNHPVRRLAYGSADSLARAAGASF